MIVPTDGMLITQDTTFVPGTYLLPNGITIAADNITLNGNGALLVGAARTGRGVTLLGRRNVQINNVRLQEYYHGIYAQHCQGLHIAECQISATAELPANTLFLNIWLPAEQAYGGAIMLWDVSDSQLQANDLQHQMNGLLCYACQRLTVRNNLANYCSGFGFHFFASSDCLVEANYADFCCRYEPRGPDHGHMGADAASFLIVHGSCRNIFRRNFARMGGDGFFLAGLTPQWQHVGCDDNLFEANDGSYSPNIAFEATFSRGNIYRANRANHCSYGFWLGFSRDCVLEQNQIHQNRQAGIAVENGVGFQVRHNSFQHNRHGILLWSKYVAAFATAVPANDTSRDWLIEQNRFIHNGTAIRIAANQDHGIRPLPAAAPGTPSAPRPHQHTIRANTIHDNRVGIELIAADATLTPDNEFQGNVEADLR